jgi:3-methyladenine DNA glycosylase AlkD
MHKEHRRLGDTLRALAGPGSVARQDKDTYSGSPHQSHGVAVPDLRRLARGWVGANRGLAAEAILAVLDSLFAGDVHDEKTLGALILGYSSTARSAATPQRADGWLDQLVGWAEIDALCSNVFQADDFLSDWAAYGPWLRRLTTDPNINKRRASLVLLTGPVRRSDDTRLAAAAFDSLRTLQAERPILITKAVSWLLRNLIARHQDSVVSYVEDNRALLPAIAVREVEAKLDTGRKTRGRR